MKKKSHDASRDILVAGRSIRVAGRWRRIARLSAEYYEFVDRPDEFLPALAASGVRAHVFTFVQRISEPEPNYAYRQERDQAAVLPLTTDENWWSRQINDKTRNMVRKAKKAGVVVSVVPFDDRLVDGIMRLYNESPVRQGRAFRHFGKDRETLAREHATFLDCSEFIVASLDGELAGFAKLVQLESHACLMNFLGSLEHRDKAVTNALMATAVKRCCARSVPWLQYGTWGRGYEGIADFRKHSGFACVRVPRYYVPLDRFGRVLIHAGLYRNPVDCLPESLYCFLKSARERCLAFASRGSTTWGGLSSEVRG